MASIWDSVTTTPTAPTTPTATTPATGNVWFNGGDYGQSQDWYNTPVAENIREQNQRLAFNAWGQRQGIGETDNTFSRWFQDQFPRFQSAYGQATLYNPTMTIDDFLATLPSYSQLQTQYNALSPNARGAQYQAYSPLARWIPR